MNGTQLHASREIHANGSAHIESSFNIRSACGKKHMSETQYLALVQIGADVDVIENGSARATDGSLADVKADVDSGTRMDGDDYVADDDLNWITGEERRLVIAPQSTNDVRMKVWRGCR